MARNLRTNAQIDRYIDQLITAAAHHALGVQSVIQPLSDEVRKKLQLGSDKIEVYERNGKIARTCWVTISSKRNVFTYNYDTGKIDLKAGGLQGHTIYSFDNSTTLGTIKHIIGSW
ncbi:hypothetical protein [Ralstonia solanacearum]|uniref:hypothetical protein n=1 Tax=Ralstonia solanacearum TaxID=305 RepID=UPI0001D96E9F|nr:hypothetical protein [Ralstonia solanacearum]CBJ36053.1 conserved hypothethical protein [Ralstonia solanacearum PSI07]